MSRSFRSFGFCLAISLLTGCGVFRHVAVEPLATGSHPPSNVGAFVSVRDGEEPLAELTAANFRVYENDQLVPSDQTQLTLLDPSLVSGAQVVLLVDMSAATTAPARARLAKGAQNFVEKVLPKAAVAVLAFDGSQTLTPIASLPRGNQAVTMAALESFTSRDASRNLNGAVVAGVNRLRTLLAQSGRQIKLGMLVLYAAGPDMAARVERDTAHDAVWESDYDTLAIAVTGENVDVAQDLARQGVIRAQAEDTLPIAFEEAAERVVAELQRHYLVSYCSPARAGMRRLRLEVTHQNKEGEEHHGDFEMDFSAKTFGPGCNPLRAPALTLVPKEPAPSREPSPSKASAEKAKPVPPDSREQEQGEDAPVPPPDRGGYAK